MTTHFSKLEDYSALAVGTHCFRTLLRLEVGKIGNMSTLATHHHPLETAPVVASVIDCRCVVAGGHGSPFVLEAHEEAPPRVQCARYNGSSVMDNRCATGSFCG